MKPKQIYQDQNLNDNKLHKAKIVIADRNAMSNDDIPDKQYVDEKVSDYVHSDEIGAADGVLPLDAQSEIPQAFVPSLQKVTNTGHVTDKITIDSTSIQLKDLSWLSQAQSSTINKQYIDPATSKVYLLGTIYTVSNGTHKCVRLNSDGTLDTSFFLDGSINQTTDIAAASAICTDTDGNVYIGFYYDLDDFPTGKRLLKLSSTGTILVDFSSKVSNPLAGTSQSYDYVSKLWHDGTDLWVSFSSNELPLIGNTYFYDSIEYSCKLFKINDTTGTVIQWFLPNDAMQMCEDFLVEDDRVIIVGLGADIMLVVMDNPVTGAAEEQYYTSQMPYYQYSKNPLSPKIERIYQIFSTDDHYYCLGQFSTVINTKSYRNLFVIDKTTFELVDAFDTTLADADLSMNYYGVDALKTAFLQNDNIIFSAGHNNLLLTNYTIAKQYGLVRMSKFGRIDDTFARKTTMSDYVLFADGSIVGLSPHIDTLTDNELPRNWYQINEFGQIILDNSEIVKMSNGSASISGDFVFNTGLYHILNKKQILSLLATTDIDVTNIIGANRELVPDALITGIKSLTATFDNDDWLELRVTSPLSDSQALLDNTIYKNCQARVTTPNGHVYVDCEILGNISNATNTDDAERILRVKDKRGNLISQFGNWSTIDIWFNISYADLSDDPAETYAKTITRGSRILLSDVSESHSILMTDWINEYYTGPNADPAINTYLLGAAAGLLSAQLWQDYAEQYGASMVTHAQGLIPSAFGIDAQSNVLFLLAHNGNTSVRFDATSAADEFFNHTVLVSAGDAADTSYATNWQTSYGFGVEFCENTYPSESVSQHEQSPATAIVAAKLMSIKDLTNASWRIVRNAARQTASNAGVWDMYRGFGVIDVDAAVALIQSVNYSQMLAKRHNDINRIEAIVKSEDIHKDAYVAKRHLPFVAEDAKVLMTSMETSSEIVTAGHIFEIGNTYLVQTLNVGDDFTNIGHVSENSPFIATGTTPTAWTNGSIVYKLNVKRNDFQNTFSAGDIKINFSADSGGDIGRYIISSDVITFSYDKTFVIGAILGSSITRSSAGATYSIDTVLNQIKIYYGGDLTANLHCQLLLAIKP